MRRWTRIGWLVLVVALAVGLLQLVLSEAEHHESIQRAEQLQD